MTLVFRKTLFSLVLIAVTATLACQGAHAKALEGPIEAEGDSYVGAASTGTVLKTGLGDCVRTGDWEQNRMIDACEGIKPPVAAAKPEPKPQPRMVSDTITGRTLFDTNSHELNESGEREMKRLFGALARYSSVTHIRVVGHADSRGSEAYNQALSERRARTIASLISARYPTAMISALGRGETMPVATNKTAEGRQQNRQVEIELKAKRKSFE